MNGLLFGEGALHSAADPGRAPQLEALLQACPTPESLARFFQEQMTFTEDMQLFGEADYWQTPEEFLDRRAGDCEDYALLAKAALQRLGFEAFVFSLYGEDGYAHTVCVFLEQGRYHVFNQDRLLRLSAGSLREVAAQLHPHWTWGAVAEQAGTRGRGTHFLEREILRARTLSGST